MNITVFCVQCIFLILDNFDFLKFDIDAFLIFRDMDIANIRIHNSQDHPFQARPFEEPQVFESGEDFSIQNGYIRAHFDKDGFLQDLTTLDDKVKTDMKLEFIKVREIEVSKILSTKNSLISLVCYRLTVNACLSF